MTAPLKIVLFFLGNSKVSTFQWKVLSFLLLANVQWCKEGLGSDSESHESQSSFVPLYSTHQNKYLPGYVIQKLPLDDWLQCLFACASTEACISYNFNPLLGMCEVNSEGATELGRKCHEKRSLLFSQGLVFHQIRDTRSYWSPWQQWSPCSNTCGHGVKRRKRVCIGSNNGGCKGKEMEKKDCGKGSDGVSGEADEDDNCEKD